MPLERTVHESFQHMIEVFQDCHLTANKIEFNSSPWGDLLFNIPHEIPDYFFPYFLAFLLGRKKMRLPGALDTEVALIIAQRCHLPSNDDRIHKPARYIDNFLDLVVPHAWLTSLNHKFNYFISD